MTVAAPCKHCDDPVAGNPLRHLIPGSYDHKAEMKELTADEMWDNVLSVLPQLGKKRR